MTCENDTNPGYTSGEPSESHNITVIQRHLAAKGPIDVELGHKLQND